MKKKIIVAIIIIVVQVAISVVTVFAADDLSKLDAGGQKILVIVRRIGYWIILIKCIADLVKAGMSGDTHSIGRIIMTYILIYGALFFVPWALRLVEGVF